MQTEQEKAAQEKVQRRKFKTTTSWEDLGVIDYGNGVTSSRFVIGEPGDDSAPLVMRGTFPPGHVVAPHSHPCDYTEIILDGTQQVGRTWLKPGDIRIVKAGTVYGPLTAGPDGATVMVIFRSGDWHTQWVTPREEAS